MAILKKIEKGFSDMVDVNSLRGKIRDEEDNIEKKKMEIGEYHWRVHSKKRDANKDALDKMYKSIENSLEKIAKYEKEIDRINKSK